MSLTRTRFALDKWYLDAVSDSGDVVVGYAARLAWGPLRVAYGALITRSAERGRAARQRQTLHFGTLAESEQGLEWSNPALGVSGDWLGGSRIAPTVLFDGPHGGVSWECLSANARVELELDGVRMSGRGYAEHLTLTALPWRLPFRELRWGRFISDDLAEYLVWTDLRGGLDRTWVWAGSAAEAEKAGRVGEREVRAGDRMLVLDAPTPIRRDDVATSLLGRARFLSAVLPRGIRAIDEDKRISPAVLHGRDGEWAGHAIDETVVWR